MATAQSICDLALDIVSVTNKVTATFLTAPSTKEDYACARWYAHVRDIVLRRFHWPFAKKYAALVEIDAELESNPEWNVLYDVPADWLKSRRVFVEGEARKVRNPIPFSTFLSDDGSKYVIGADTSSLTLEYTRKIDTDALLSLAPATFVDAVASKLAAKIVKPLSLDAGLIKEAEGLYLAAVHEAFADAVEEQQFDPQPDAEWIEERG